MKDAWCLIRCSVVLIDSIHQTHGCRNDRIKRKAAPVIVVGFGKQLMGLPS